MGILRTDRVTGLGGANAITGSAFFAAGKATTTSSDYNLGTDDFTIECFVYFSGKNPTLGTIFETRSSTTASDGFLLGRFQTSGHENKVELYTDQDYRVTADRTVENDTWVHIAVVRASATTKVYVDGTAYSSTYSDSNNYSNTEIIFGKNAPNSDTHQLTGFISNFHVVKGTAIYTSNFTPPTNQIQKRSDTVFLGFQSASDVTREETGKIITFPVSGHNGVSHGPDTSKSVISSRFTPNSPVGFSTTTDVGTQFGSTFDGVTTFDSQAYFVPPGGNTRERNRGRAIFAGGAASPYKDIQVVDISSGGIAQDFGETTTAAPNSGSASSSTRMLVTSGGTPAPINTIEFITIADIASSTDFGDLTEPRRRTQSLSNSTRAVHVGGTSASPASLYRNEIDFNTIATAGNSTDFGDTLAAHVATGGSVASSTRGVYSVGFLNGSYVNTLEFITIATTGNGQDFGDLNGGTIGYHHRGSTCDSTRGLFSGGYNPLGQVQNKIDFITIASTGNATDFGDLSVARRSAAGTANSTHSIFAGGYLPGVSNTIDRVVIQTTGNAADFGDFFFKTHENSGSSDSHGGLS